ncbi:hypothetical protein SAMN00777080_3725 [Aquiflexum balticum DSM 16537]|uniref:Uncharacterized protein n=1 Tax=Aquiflexum balticum DSM 16537 TaxID=758820 RepID=A0A1W2H858_9BACT|nr:hypothetical protein SAMN00777080_3725 [Aquiflexum balticum DSM 16537]
MTGFPTPVLFLKSLLKIPPLGWLFNSKSSKTNGFKKKYPEQGMVSNLLIEDIVRTKM